MIMQKWNENKWIFKDIHGYGYPYYHIHPYKQEAVKHLVDNVYEGIDYVFIFGSSVFAGHFYKSDLDVCLVGEMDDASLTALDKIKTKDVRFDFVNVSSLEKLEYAAKNYIGYVYDYIFNEGVCVYENHFTNG